MFTLIKTTRSLRSMIINSKTNRRLLFILINMSSSLIPMIIISKTNTSLVLMFKSSSNLTVFISTFIIIKIYMCLLSAGQNAFLSLPEPMYKSTRQRRYLYISAQRIWIQEMESVFHSPANGPHIRLYFMLNVKIADLEKGKHIPFVLRIKMGIPSFKYTSVQI